MRTGWVELGDYWLSNSSWSLKRQAFKAKVQESGLSGMLSYSLRPNEMKTLDSQMITYLRVMEQGNATEKVVGSTYHKRVSNFALLRKWRLLPMSGEMAVRNFRWVQSL